MSAIESKTAGPTALEKLQQLLGTLFQFEFSDLDFGIYRLFRLKQDELKAFIGKQLPEAVDKAFADVAESGTKQLSAEVGRLAERIRSEVDPAALLDNGATSPEFRHEKAKSVQELFTEYETKKTRLDAVRVTEEQKLDVFNHLYNFFSRYYDAGDFIPRRFSGARPHYTVPYNGEETHFHWANKDQHYVKTAEAFRDYVFTVDALGGPFRVRFIITSANVPKDNTKGDRRYFFPLPAEARYDQDTKTFTLPFHYRLPTEDEVKGGSENGTAVEEQKQKRLTGEKLQEALLRGALNGILAKVTEPALAAVLGEVLNTEAVEKEGAEPVRLIFKRLRHFARRNTTDYFIHKHLRTFLAEELEFYLKDQILHIGDLEGDFEGKRRMLGAFHQLANDLITFLAQIEEVQLRLFENRKFILRADYLVMLAHVPRELWKEILDPKRGAKQLAEWKQLYAFHDCAELLAWKGKLTQAFLEKHPTLVVNTAYFDDAFKERLLDSFDDLDAVTDGILVHSENYQALRLLERSLYGRVDFTYIDPPYNTGEDDFIYKDCYQRSSWLALMHARLAAGRQLMRRTGTMAVSIDDIEFGRLVELCRELFPGDVLATLVWDRNRKNDARFFSVGHEYMLVVARSKEALEEAGVRFREPKEGLEWAKRIIAKLKKQYGESYEKITEEWLKAFDDVPVADPRRRLIRYNKVGKRGPFRDDKDISWPGGGGPKYPVLHAITKKPVKIPSRGWMYPTVERFWEAYDQGDVVFGPDGTTVPTGATYLFEDDTQVMPSVFYSYAQTATQEFEHICGKGVFDNPKPWRDLLRLCRYLAPDARAIVLDFFAGSGTTAHAVTACNRAFGGSRRCVLVEMEPYFDTVLLPRFVRIWFTPDWRDCRPVRLATADEASRSPRLVKVLHLESYEDALHNLTTGETMARSEPRAAAHTAHLGTETYRLHYLARLPMEESASMVQLEKLEHPFAYTLEILTEDGPKTQTVDLVETFNYLLGLDVWRLETWTNSRDKSCGQARRYRVVKGKDRSGKRYLVIWRDMTGLDPKVERDFLEARLKQEKEPFDRMLINGDSATPDFGSLDVLFKQLMTG